MTKFGSLCSVESYEREVLVDQAVNAAGTGFDLILSSDHFHPWVDGQSAAGCVCAWLGAVAAPVGVDLAMSVTCPTGIGATQVASTNPDRVLDILPSEVLPELPQLRQSR